MTQYNGSHSFLDIPVSNQEAQSCRNCCITKIVSNCHQT